MDECDACAATALQMSLSLNKHAANVKKNYIQTPFPKPFCTSKNVTVTYYCCCPGNFFTDQ